MTIYSLYIFDRHCECVYIRQWHERSRPLRSELPSSPSVPVSVDKRASLPPKQPQDWSGAGGRLSVHDDAKLIFGVVFSLRNMVKKLSGPDDAFLSYRTTSYKLHYYETPTNLKFVLLTDVRENNLRAALHQIYVKLYVEYVTLNPLSPVEHRAGEGMAVELFELGLDSFIRSIQVQ